MDTSMSAVHTISNAENILYYSNLRPVGNQVSAGNIIKYACAGTTE